MQNKTRYSVNAWQKKSPKRTEASRRPDKFFRSTTTTTSVDVPSAFVFWVLRRKRRGFSLKRPRCQCLNVYDLKNTAKGCQSNSTSPLNSHAKKNINALKLLSLKKKKKKLSHSHSKGGARPPFDLLKIYKNEEAHSRNEGTPSFRRRYKMFTLFKTTNYSSDQGLYSKETKLGLTNSLPSEPSFTTSACHFYFSNHIPRLY